MEHFLNSQNLPLGIVVKLVVFSHFCFSQKVLGAF